MSLFLNHRDSRRRRVCVEPLEGRVLLAYTFTLAGSVATATGDAASDTLTIGASGGLLFHSVNGSTPDFVWSSVGSAPVTLAAGPDSTVNITQGTGKEAVDLVSSSQAGASLNGTIFNLLAGGAADTLQVDDTADSSGGNTYVISGASITGPGIDVNIQGPPLGGGVTVLGGTGGNTIDVVSTAAGQAVAVVGNGADNVSVGGGSLAGLNASVAVSDAAGKLGLTVDDSPIDVRVSAPANLSLTGNSTGTSTLSGAPLTTATITAVTSEVATYAVRTGLANDSLSVDLSGNDPVPTGGLTYDGGAGTNTLGVNAGGRGVNASKPGLIAVAGVGPLNYVAAQTVNVFNTADLPLSAVPVAVTGTENVPLTNVNAGSFTDSDPNGAAANFSALINWGDGTPSTVGTVVKDPKSGFDVLGSHTYAASGSYAIAVAVKDNGSSGTTDVAGVAVTLSDNGGSTTVVNSTATIAAAPQRFVVTTTADLVGGVPAPGSLRALMLDANANPGPDTIIFDIVPRASTYDIKLNAPLPAVTGPVTIDATTQPGYQGQPIVLVNGSGISGDGLLFDVGNSTVRGLAVGGFSGAGIRLASGGNDLIENDFIGTDTTGTNPLGNGVGVEVDAGTGTTIGGTAANSGNVISGNLTAGVYLNGSSVTGTLVIGNQIGTDPGGTGAVTRTGVSNPLQALQNTGVAIVDSSGNTIGGSAAADANVVSGNYVGVTIAGSGAANIVQGNRIGTDVSGTKAIGNIVGVYLNGASANQVGGAGAGQGNTISGNSSVGVEIFGAATANSIEGDLIGPAADGLSVLRAANGTLMQQSGVYVEGASGNTIGGTAAGAGDTISGNELAGVYMLSRSGTASGNVVEGDFIGLAPGGGKGAVNDGYGVLLYDAANNTIVRTGATSTLFGRNAQGNVKVFTGPVPSATSASSLQAPDVRTLGRQATTHHPASAPKHPAIHRPMRKAAR